MAFNAHPDDEAMLTGGTLALAAAAGHRVVLVTATDGDSGPAARPRTDQGLGCRRLRELEASAIALGAARWVHLGYSDSGLGDQVRPVPPGRTRLVEADPEEVADRLGEVLRTEAADLLLGYDEAGGYGHPDHVAVHHAARRSAARTGVRLLEATAPREPLLRALRVLGLLRLLPHGFSPDEWAQAFTPRARITHRVDVRPVLPAKRAAMRAHVSQTTSSGPGGGTRNLALALRAPLPLYRLVLGHEYFTDPDGPTGGAPARDIFGGTP